MPEDYYQSGGGPGPAKADTPDESEQETALIPKSMFGGKMPEPGDDCTFHVEHIYGDEVEVSYVSDPEKKKSSMDDADMAMDKMASPPTEEGMEE